MYLQINIIICVQIGGWNSLILVSTIGYYKMSATYTTTKKGNS